MEKIQELRDAHFERQQKNVLMVKIQGQFAEIIRLKREREVLQQKITALKEGHPTTDLYPDYVQDPEFFILHNTFAKLKQKLSIYRLLGPCGLTVLDVQSNSLAVSFTSVWKDLTQTFVLQFTDDSNNRVKVTGTNIPYFIDVDAIFTNPDSLEWSKLMEEIGNHLNAYTQRRREIEHVESNYKEVIKLLSYNDSKTSVEMYLISNPGPDKLQLEFSLSYNGMKDVCPTRVRLASSHFIPKSKRTELRNLLKTGPLSEIFPALIEKMMSISADILESEDDYDSHDNVSNV